jgi:hypothetical protein
MIFVLFVSLKNGTSLRFYFAEALISSTAQNVGVISKAKKLNC